MNKLLLLLFAILPVSAWAQTVQTGDGKVSISDIGQLPTSTYSGLPTCTAARDGKMYKLTDQNRDVYKCIGSSGTWVSQNGGVYNVKDFGAVGDGSSDDTTAVRAAISATSNNTTVFFPPGTYAIGAAGLTIASKTGVVLAGSKATIKLTAVGTQTILSYGYVSILFDTCTQCGIRDLVINGNSQATIPVGIKSGTSCFAVNNTITGSATSFANIALGAGSRNLIASNSITSSTSTARGVWAGNTGSGETETDVVVRDNYIYGLPATGIGVVSTGGRVTGNISSANGGSGIVVAGATGRRASNIVISQNTTSGNSFYGIQSDVTYSTSADLTASISVIDNIVSTNTLGGIYAVNVQDWTISKNIVFDNSGDGIRIDRATRVVCIANRVFDSRSGGSRTQSRGIYLSSTTDNNTNITITDNTLYNHVNDGIKADTSGSYLITGLVILGNQSLSNSGYGLTVVEASSGQITGVMEGGGFYSNNSTYDVRFSITDIPSRAISKSGTAFDSSSSIAFTSASSTANAFLWRMYNSATASTGNANDWRVSIGGPANYEGYFKIGRGAFSTHDFGISETGNVYVVNSLSVGASLSLAYVAKTTTYAIAASDYTIDCTSGSFTVTLPTAVGVTGKIYVIKNSGAGTITIATTSAQTIDGAAPGTILAGKQIMVQSDGANWKRIVSNTAAWLDVAQTWSATQTFTNGIFSSQNASTVPYLDASKQLTSSSVTPTELGYVSGVTSAIQTQLNAKAPLVSPSFTTPSLGVATATSIAIGGGTALTTSNQTGTGSLVLSNNANLVAPNIDVAIGTSLTLTGGDITLSTAGKSISVKTGSNACAGVATLNTGTVTVSTTCVGATYGTDYAIILTPKGSSTGVVRVSTVTANTSFVITSTDGASSDNVAWWIIRLT